MQGSVIHRCLKSEKLLILQISQTRLESMAPHSPQQKNQSFSAKKERVQCFGFVLRCIRSGPAAGAVTPVVRSRVPKRQPSTNMIMKFCPNYRCVAYGRVVYTQTTRCAFCRWDLKPPRMKSEPFADQKTSVDAGEAVPAPAKTDSHAQARNTLFRRPA